MIDWTNITSSSSKILLEIDKNGTKLTDKDRQVIIDVVYEAVTAAYNYESNGCDCGQMSCGTCN